MLIHIVRHVVIMFRRSWGPSPTRDILYRHKTERVQGDLTSDREQRRGQRSIVNVNYALAFTCVRTLRIDRLMP